MRTILLRHAQPQEGPGAAATLDDPNALVGASRLRAALAALDGPAQRQLAADYVALWARTFRTLVRHLRGRPDRALALFAEEVWPFLRGDRLAARIEARGPRQARLLLAPDLPAPYVAGLVEAFVGLSGATVRAEPLGNGVFSVGFQLAGAARVARATQALATLRLPLLLAAFLAALAGLAIAGAGLVGNTGDAALVGVVLVGVLAAQAGANLLHAARHGPLHPFAPPQPAPRVAAAASAGLYLVAAACAAWLVAARGRTGMVAFAGLGLLLGVAYAAVRQRGLGPAIAGLTYGALVPVGAAYAADPAVLATPFLVVLAGAPLGLAAAALLFLDNVADRPLDEAGGQRTLAVRLPERRHLLVFGALVAGAALAVAAWAWPAGTPWFLAAGAVLGVGGARLVATVARHLADPHGLAPARLGALAFLAAAGLAPLAFAAVLHA